MRFIIAFAFAVLALPALALELDAPFGSIDGGELRVSDWQSRPVLVVNTASRCGFTHQYEELQELYDRYRDRGLVVLAVPSNDFRQELASDDEVKDFCEVNFGLDIPMTTITSVRGSQAHPLYASLADEAGFAPSWNFNKVLIAPDGTVASTWGSAERPTSQRMTKVIEALLP
ncbi:MAG: glutathione peroxidase [Roseovarius sp.]